jgi:hypothetical protein
MSVVGSGFSRTVDGVDLLRSSPHQEWQLGRGHAWARTPIVQGACTVRLKPDPAHTQWLLSHQSTLQPGAPAAARHGFGLLDTATAVSVHGPTDHARRLQQPRCLAGLRDQGRRRDVTRQRRPALSGRANTQTTPLPCGTSVPVSGA